MGATSSRSADQLSIINYVNSAEFKNILCRPGKNSRMAHARNPYLIYCKGREDTPEDVKVCNYFDIETNKRRREEDVIRDVVQALYLRHHHRKTNQNAESTICTNCLPKTITELKDRTRSLIE